MFKVLWYMLFVLYMGCGSMPAREEADIGRISDSSSTTKKVAKHTLIKGDTTGFFLNCKNWATGSSGYLQGVESTRDSLGPFCIYDCYDKESFEIIFAYKDFSTRRKTPEDSIWKSYKDGCANSFNGFQCFSFVLPMRDPDKQKDEHAMNIDFPVTVKVYKRIQLDRWQHIRTVRVRTFEDYSRLQFNTIYELE